MSFFSKNTKKEKEKGTIKEKKNEIKRWLVKKFILYLSTSNLAFSLNASNAHIQTNTIKESLDPATIQNPSSISK